MSDDALKLAREFLDPDQSRATDWPDGIYWKGDTATKGGCPMSRIEFVALCEWRERVEWNYDVLACAVIAQAEALDRLQPCGRCGRDDLRLRDLPQHAASYMSQTDGDYEIGDLRVSLAAAEAVVATQYANLTALKAALAEALDAIENVTIEYDVPIVPLSSDRIDELRRLV